MGERVNGIHEVRGSIPLGSTSPTLRANIRQGVWTQYISFHGRATRWSSRRPEAAAGIAQLVEHNLAKVGVAGSSPVSRSYEGGLTCPRFGRLSGRALKS